jgi:cysteine-rich repeat protein
MQRSFLNYWDDGDLIDGDGWDLSWTIEAGWTCNGGSPTTADTWIDICGDGLVMNRPMGKCDDGNTGDGDGCDNSWNVEFGWSWTGGSTTTQDSWSDIWGDGYIVQRATSSYWDDGNSIDGDGCDSSCSTEAGWTWDGGSGSTSDTCKDLWGDGIMIKSINSNWDDGNLINGDGCSNNCQVEEDWICTPGDSTSKSIWKKIEVNAISEALSEGLSEVSSKPYVATAGMAAASMSSMLTFSSPSNVWQIGNLLQMFMLLLLLDVYIPAKVITFITTNIFALLSFQIPFLNEIRDFILGDVLKFFESEQKDEKLKLLDVKSRSTPINIFNSILFFTTIATVHLLLVLPIYKWTSGLKRKLKENRKNRKYILGIRRFIWEWFTFTFYIRFAIQSSQYYLLCSLSELMMADLSTPGHIVSWAMAFALFSLWVFLLILNFYEIIRKDPNSKKLDYLVEFIKGLKEDKLSYSYNVLLISRRLIFLIWILCFKWLPVKLLIIVLTIFQLLYTIGVTFIRPYKVAKDNLFDIINEVTYLILIGWLVIVDKEYLWSGYITNAYLGVLMFPGLFMLGYILGKMKVYFSGTRGERRQEVRV